MSPTDRPKKFPQSTPRASIEAMDRRRRSMAAGSSPADVGAADGADDSADGSRAAVASAADGADGGRAAVASAADGADGGRAVVASAADGADGGRAAVVSAADGADEREERLGLAIVGQELVPVSDRRVGNLEEESPEKGTNPERFQTPSAQRSLGTPDQLQLNVMSLKTNEQSEKKDENDGKSQLSRVPNGPPVSLGPASGTSAPLFTPEQIAQATDPRNSSSLLPLTRESNVSGDFSRIPGFLQGLLPGLDHFQEARQRELEWRANMEVMMEQLGLQLRAAHSENARLRQELVEARKEASQYGTPDEERSSEKGKVHRSTAVMVNQNKEDGVVTRQEQRLALGNSINKKKGKDWTMVHQEDGTRVQQAFQDIAHSNEQSDQSQSSEEEQGKEDGQERQQVPGATESQTMHLLLKIVQGMQSMQKQILEGKEDQKEESEVVRYSPELPRLPEWNVETAPIDYGDWIT